MQETLMTVIPVMFHPYEDEIITSWVYRLARANGMSIREYATEYGAPRTTVQYQRTKLLKKLRATLESEDGFSLDTVYAAFEQNEG